MNVDAAANKAFYQWFLDCVTKKYADFNGRARRKEFWMFLLVTWLLGILCMIIASIIPMVGMVLYCIIALGLIIPNLAVAVRRLHDVNKSGWFLLLSLVPIISLYLLYLFIQDGTPGDNRFGPNPKGV